jgi:coenzyme Q-binding protein COQ10
MPTISIEHILPYTPEQMFNLVADIESYPEFLPWCSGARVWERKEESLLADLLIHFKGFVGKYTSRVFFDRKENEISVELVHGPFKHLHNGWKFIPHSEGVRVQFDLDFELSSKILQSMMGFMFENAFKKMLTAFEERASILYAKNGEVTL